MAQRRAYTTVLAPAVVAAALATGQVALAEATGATTLTSSFVAGGERVVDVQMTLVAYFCATAVVIATTALRGGRRLRRLRPVAAACGALVPIPLIVARADEYVGGLATDAVLAGAIVGAIAAFALAGTPNAAVGVGAHLALLWVAALAFLPWVDPTEVYAGLVQPRGTSAVGYHLPTMLPYAVVAIVLCGVLGAWFARRAEAAATASAATAGAATASAATAGAATAGAATAGAATAGAATAGGATAGTGAAKPSRWPAVRAAAAGPVLAVVLYPVVGMTLWNGQAAPVTAAVAVLGCGAAAVGASWGRRKPTAEQAGTRAGKPTT
jgi:hypothetical protein